MTTSTDIANQAIEMIGGNQPPVTGVAPTFDSSKAGVALQSLYAPAVASVARQFGWDFARNTATLTVSGNTAPVGWLYEYLYPSMGIELWQLVPASLTDANDPLPQNWAVGNAVVGATQTKVIWANLINAKAVFNNNPTEATWDPLFREAVVRLLASELAIALGGKPDTADFNLRSGAAFERLGEQRQD